MAVGDVLRVYETGSVLEGPDGTEYYQDALGVITGGIKCGTGPNEILCTEAGLGRLLNTTDSRAPAAILDVQTQLYAAVVGPLGDAALSNLGAYQLARVSPTLAALQLSPLAALPVTESIGFGTGLQAQIQQELQTNTQQLLDLGIKTGQYDSLSDPELSAYKRYLNAIDTSARLQPLVQAQLEKSVSLLDDLFGSTSYSTPTYSIPTYSSFGYPQSDGSYAGYPDPTVTAGSPAVSTTSGGILDTLSGVLQSALPYIPNILTSLSNAGVIGGTVGQLFQTPQVQPLSVSGLGAVSASPVDPCQAALDQQGYLGYATCKLFGTNMPFMPQNPPPTGVAPMTMTTINPATGLPMVGTLPGCQRGPAVVNMLTASGLFRLGCSGYKTVNRAIVEKPNGQRDLYVRVGQIASPSPKVLKRFAKRWAKSAGLHCNERSSRRSGGYRRRRRSPR